ncbi:MAG TPA: adenylosuccinate synthase [Candidatus Cloacimonadota bacterium]|nr:adenylosuccinate synthase [Candidatus Cloacimonadota bacterium]
MSSTAVLGCLWGDEAKAKIVDVLGANADIVVRFQGGSNAGHTIYSDGQKYILHTLPSGILYPHTVCVIGSGVVLDVFSLLEEMQALEQRGIHLQDRLLIDMRAALVLPLHKDLDAASEDEAQQYKIGTTRRGIGPAYADDTARVGLRLNDLYHGEYLAGRLDNLYRYHHQKSTVQEMETLINELKEAGEKLQPYVAQTDTYLRKKYAAGARILFEGAQGTLLDLTYGTYPFVTSSHTMVGGISVGAGIPFKMVDKIIGVYKAYATRVGEGPFPTELKTAPAEQIRQQGNEYGSTTGRPRRVGWFDAVAAKYTSDLNGLDSLAVTLLDVLSGLPEVKICTAYQIDGKRITDYPSDPFLLAKAVPEFISLNGWEDDISACTKVGALPKSAQDYIIAIRDLLKVPVEIISVGHERGQTIFLNS